MVVDPVLWLLSRMLVLPLLHAPPLRMRRAGLEHLPREGPVLVVCNHVSVADPIVLMAAARPRRTAMMAKSELFRNPLLGWYLRGVRAFPIRRGCADVGAVRTACRLLDEGHCVVVFPEGRVTRSGLMRPGYPGAGMLALRPGVVTVPAVVWDTQLFRGPARVRFGPPVNMSDVAPGPRRGRNREATDRIMTALAGLLPAAGGPAQPPPLGPPPLAATPAAATNAVAR